VKGERVALRDGSQVLIRQIQPADAALMADGFARLSVQSRWLRFLTSKPELSPAELRYFTEVDHHDHEALAAVNETDERGLGVARFIRDTEHPDTAEVAVTVADDWQDRGLGTELLIKLTNRARQEGIRRFTAMVAADNEAVRGLLQASSTDLKVTHREAGTVEYELTLAPVGLGGELHALLRAFGRRRLKAPKPIRDALSALIPNRFTANGE
jgi:RimJ/RimL family protein N-acetyltransferase